MTRYKVQEFEWGFMTCNVDTDTPPATYIKRCGVNEEEAEQINASGSSDYASNWMRGAAQLYI